MALTRNWHDNCSLICGGVHDLRITICIAAVLFASATAALPARLVMPDQSAAPGASIAIPLQFYAQGAGITALQFDLEFDASAITFSAILGDPARSAFKSLYMVDLAPNQKRVLIVGLNQDRIGDGALIDFFGSVYQNAPVGAYTLTLSNLVATDSSGKEVPMTGTNGSVTVQGTVGDAVRLQTEGVLSAASLLAGPIAPGELVTLIGVAIGPPSPQQSIASSTSTILGGTSVLFDGTPAPLLYASLNQINLVVPFEVYGKKTARLEIIDQGQTIATLPLPVGPAAPAIFTQDTTGFGPGAILNQDSSLNSPSNPAVRGSVVAIYATGFGQTNPPGVDGQITGEALAKPLLSASVQIGGVDAMVTYAGAAPGLIAGVMQVNVRVPAGAPVGPAIPIQLTAGQVSSPAGVTLSIR